jgi:hypothetical protein
MLLTNLQETEALKSTITSYDDHMRSPPYIGRTASAKLLPGCTIPHFDFSPLCLRYVQFSVDFFFGSLLDFYL